MLFIAEFNFSRNCEKFITLKTKKRKLIRISNKCILCSKKETSSREYILSRSTHNNAMQQNKMRDRKKGKKNKNTIEQFEIPLPGDRVSDRRQLVTALGRSAVSFQPPPQDHRPLPPLSPFAPSLFLPGSSYTPSHARLVTDCLLSCIILPPLPEPRPQLAAAFLARHRDGRAPRDSCVVSSPRPGGGVCSAHQVPMGGTRRALSVLLLPPLCCETRSRMLWISTLYGSAPRVRCVCRNQYPLSRLGREREREIKREHQPGRRPRQRRRRLDAKVLRGRAFLRIFVRLE